MHHVKNNRLFHLYHIGLLLPGEHGILLRSLRSGDTNQFDLFGANFEPTPAYSSTYWSFGLKLLGGGHCQGSSAWKLDVFLY